MYFDDDDSLTLYDAPIEVRLITHRTPRTDCYPNDDGIDTSYRYIHFIRSTNVFLGTWRDSFSENPNEVYDIKLYIDSSLALQPGQNNNYDALYIDNLYNEQIFCNVTYIVHSRFTGRHRTVYTNEVGVTYIEDCSREVYTHRNLYSMIIEVNTEKNTIYLEWNQRFVGINEVKRVSFKGERL